MALFPAGQDGFTPHVKLVLLDKPDTEPHLRVFTVISTFSRSKFAITVMIALTSFAAAQKPSGTQVESIYQRGMAALQKGNLPAARTAFEKVVKLAPKSPEPHNSLGWVLLNQGQLEPAIAQFRTALRLKPNFPQARINLANALTQDGKLEDAEAQAREAVRIAPNDSEAHRTLGRILSFQADRNGTMTEHDTIEYV